MDTEELIREYISKTNNCIIVTRCEDPSDKCVYYTSCSEKKEVCKYYNINTNGCLSSVAAINKMYAQLKNILEEQ
jgi:hypothetical protein